MAGNLYFEFGPDVADRLAKLTQRYKENSPAATVARALGLLEAIEPFLHDGLLTVIDPTVSDDPEAEREVDLQFEEPLDDPPAQRAA